MAYEVIYDEVALRILKKLGKQIARRIIKWLEARLIGCENPRLWGCALKGELGEFWRYRIGNYRLICKIQDKKLIVCVLDID